MWYNTPKVYFPLFYKGTLNETHFISANIIIFKTVDLYSLCNCNKVEHIRL